MAILPDPVQRPKHCLDNLLDVTGRGEFLHDHVTLVRFISGKRRCFDEGGDLPTVQPLTAQFSRRELGIQTDGLAHFFIGCDPLSETTAADKLLFWRWGFLQRNATFAVKLLCSPFQNDVKVLTDKCWVGSD